MEKVGNKTETGLGNKIETRHCAEVLKKSQPKDIQLAQAYWGRFSKESEMKKSNRKNTKIISRKIFSILLRPQNI